MNSLVEYEEFIYTLPKQFPAIDYSTLVVSQPHPNEPSLAVGHPHHKHIPPDIKHHRLPAPELSFTRANLPFLIAEIEHALLGDAPPPGVGAGNIARSKPDAEFD
ncbi:MAG: hypothetical protein ACREA2_08365 [Blastocatellia bacterium]